MYTVQRLRVAAAHQHRLTPENAGVFQPLFSKARRRTGWLSGFDARTSRPQSASPVRVSVEPTVPRAGCLSAFRRS
jgi:hypothetical protein